MTEAAANWRDVARRAWAEGQRISAVGPGSLDDHLDHAEAMARAIGGGVASALDLGTGAGLPGLALAGLRPEISWTLLDAAQRRVRIVEAVVAEAGWGHRVSVVHARAEDWARRAPGATDVVIARLFGPPAVTAECAAPLLAPGGRILVSDVASASVEERWPDAPLAVLGLRRGQRWASPTIQELVREGTPEDRFPRKPGVASRRPLWETPAP